MCLRELSLSRLPLPEVPLTAVTTDDAIPLPSPAMHSTVKDVGGHAHFSICRNLSSVWRVSNCLWKCPAKWDRYCWVELGGTSNLFSFNYNKSLSQEINVTLYIIKPGLNIGCYLNAVLIYLQYEIGTKQFFATLNAVFWNWMGKFLNKIKRTNKSSNEWTLVVTSDLIRRSLSLAACSISNENYIRSL